MSSYNDFVDHDLGPLYPCGLAQRVGNHFLLGMRRCDDSVDDHTDILHPCEVAVGVLLSAQGKWTDDSVHILSCLCQSMYLHQNLQGKVGDDSYLVGMRSDE